MKRTRFVAIGGFLGAGKTTTVLRSLEILRARGLKGVYIANDQGEGLVDTAFAREAQAETEEIIGGCFCCRFDDLIGTATRIAETSQPDVILAEAVGSCTDLIATVINPIKMRHARRFDVAPYTVVVDPERYAELNNSREGDELRYLFGKQLEEAQIIALNKTDLLSGEDLGKLTGKLQTLSPRADVIAYSAQVGIHLDNLVDRWLGETSSEARALELSYDIYARAEAGLAWLNAEVNIEASSESFRPTAWVQDLLGGLAKLLDETGSRIGHLKVSFETDTGFTKASVIGNGSEVHFSRVQPVPASVGKVLINARAELEPEQLATLLKDALNQADIATKVTSQLFRLDVFSPSRPEPAHRLEYDGRPLSW